MIIPVNSPYHTLPIMMCIVSAHLLPICWKTFEAEFFFVLGFHDHFLEEVIWSETSGNSFWSETSGIEEKMCNTIIPHKKTPWGKGDNKWYKKYKALAKLIIFTVQEYEDTHSHKYTRACTHTHLHTLFISLSLSLSLSHKGALWPL